LTTADAAEAEAWRQERPPSADERLERAREEASEHRDAEL
jgi:hypothetical protein